MLASLAFASHVSVCTAKTSAPRSAKKPITTPSAADRIDKLAKLRTELQALRNKAARSTGTEKTTARAQAEAKEKEVAAYIERFNLDVYGAGAEEGRAQEFNEAQDAEAKLVAAHASALAAETATKEKAEALAKRLDEAVKKAATALNLPSVGNPPPTPPTFYDVKELFPAVMTLINEYNVALGTPQFGVPSTNGTLPFKVAGKLVPLPSPLTVESLIGDKLLSAGSKLKMPQTVAIDTKLPLPSPLTISTLIRALNDAKIEKEKLEKQAKEDAEAAAKKLEEEKKEAEKLMEKIKTLQLGVGAGAAPGGLSAAEVSALKASMLQALPGTIGIAKRNADTLRQLARSLP